MSDTAAARRPGRPAQLSKEQILQAAGESENVDAITMRELADRLGVSHSALYRWVKNRDELFELISETLIENVLEQAEPLTGDWRDALRRLATAMHDEFLSVAGYATHLSRPHPHNHHSTNRLREVIVGIFRSAGLDDESAEHSWYIVITGVVGWLAFQEQPHHIGRHAPSFGIYLDVLLRGLPARAGAGATAPAG